MIDWCLLARAAALSKMKSDPAFGNTMFANISFVGTEKLVAKLGSNGDVLISQVMPSPTDSQLKIVQEYRDAMKSMGQKPSYASLEGYLTAAAFVQSLKAQENLNRQAFFNTLKDFKQI